MSLTNKQQHFLDEVRKGKNIFLTGKAGTGKSYVVNAVKDLLKQMGKKFICVAPTGVAANNIGGVTIHSQCSIFPNGIMSFEKCKFVNHEKRAVLNAAEVWIIDEVSMLRPDILDAMHWTLKKNGMWGLGSRQIIFIGDMKQLPPIYDDNERSVLLQMYDGTRFTDAQIYQQLKPQTIELDEVLRQTDEDFINALNVVREGQKSDYFRQFVHTEPSGIILAPYNRTVLIYNQKGYDDQEGRAFCFEAKIEGELKPEDFNLERTIHVKDGCKIMYLVNSKENPLVNGTMGIFRHREGGFFIEVGKVQYSLNAVTQEKKKYVYDKDDDELKLKSLGSITQYPFKLAYALSIHKSQGLTFDEVTVDLSIPCFQKEQMYVALSRVRTPQGLKILIK